MYFSSDARMAVTKGDKGKAPASPKSPSKAVPPYVFFSCCSKGLKIY